MSKRIAAVITDVLGDRVVVLAEAIAHTIERHFPLGDATQASSGEGVGFFSPTGDIQGVTFDDVCERSDNQVLEFDGYRLEVSVRRGKVSYQLRELSPPKKPARVVKEKSA